MKRRAVRGNALMILVPSQYRQISKQAELELPDQRRHATSQPIRVPWQGMIESLVQTAKPQSVCHCARTTIIISDEERHEATQPVRVQI